MIPANGRTYIIDAALYGLDNDPKIALLGFQGKTKKADFFIGVISGCPLLSGYIDYSDAETLFSFLLKNLGAFKEHSDEFADSFFEMSDTFDQVVESRSSNPSSPLAQMKRHGTSWMESALEQIFSEADESPDSDPDSDDTGDADEVPEDDSWSPIALERVGDKYEAAVSASEAAYDEIKGSNGYAESDPEERDLVVGSIGETLKQVKEHKPTTREQVLAGLVKPLKFISEKFANASMGEAAKMAVKALLSWLGLN